MSERKFFLLAYSLISLAFLLSSKIMGIIRALWNVSSLRAKSYLLFRTILFAISLFKHNSFFVRVQQKRWFYRFSVSTENSL